ncbi:Glycine-tRNA synthetase heterodimeric protein [Dioscorea alata]|uniref:Glycine-tRNA synthetase heterodimeric protein n=1 Tax=Dioscorea alata TaxID=55571 RepID=A0ACB7VGP4_DIOAL|nr:Glycine-tRNA synthetase heterodimeric protein [Dioscorea alata]
MSFQILWGLCSKPLEKHQRYFHLIDDSSNKLLPYCIAVANGVIDKVVVTKGNEAVPRARYEDAKFFYRLDIQRKFSEFRRELSGIHFYEKLGTMLDKVSRIEKTVGKLSTALGLSRTFVPVLEEAVGLAMSDLATSVVTEFTSLAGIMGRHYALRDGYSQQVFESQFEITLPQVVLECTSKDCLGHC